MRAMRDRGEFVRIAERSCGGHKRAFFGPETRIRCDNAQMSDRAGFMYGGHMP